MIYYLICFLVLTVTASANLIYVSVFYHRGLAHGSVTLKPWVRRMVALTGNWVTGLDAKAWVCMHRRHHQSTDTKADPHSPVNLGVPGVLAGQLRSYESYLALLIAGHPGTTAMVADLDFPVNWVNRFSWTIPYVVHLAIAIGLGVLTHGWLVGAVYFLGLMSHPVQGWMVNALGHAYGYRNFDTPDVSRNNTLVAWTVAGEGYQNNHHHDPKNPNMAVKWFEFDFGYQVCRVLDLFGVISINHRPARTQPSAEPELKLN